MNFVLSNAITAIVLGGLALLGIGLAYTVRDAMRRRKRDSDAAMQEKANVIARNARYQQAVATERTDLETQAVLQALWPPAGVQPYPGRVSVAIQEKWEPPPDPPKMERKQRQIDL